MNTMSNYDSIDKALNTSSAIDVTPTSKPQKVESTKDDVQKDYDYTRANLYSLVEKVKKHLMVFQRLQVKVVVPEHMKLQDR